MLSLSASLQWFQKQWAQPSGRRRAYFALLATLVIWGVADLRQRGVVDVADPGLHKTDLTVYTEAGAAFFDGRPPYEVTNIRGWSYLYPPLFALLMAPLAALPATEQVLAWYALSLLTAWGCVSETRRLARLLGAKGDNFASSDASAAPWPTWIWWTATLTVLLPILNCLQRGQVGVLLLYLLLLGLRYSLQGQTLWAQLAAGLAFAASIVLKVTPLAPVGCWCFQACLAAYYHGSKTSLLQVEKREQRREPSFGGAAALSCAVCLGLALFLGALPAGFIGWQKNAEHLTTWWTLVGAKSNDNGYDQFAGDSHSVRNQSLANAAYRLGNWVGFVTSSGPDDRLVISGGEVPMVMDAPLAKQLLLAARLLLLTLLAWPVWTTARRQDRLGQAVTFGLACVATLVAAPIARGHYFMLLMPAVLLLPAWLMKANRPRAAKRVAYSALALVAAHYLALNIAGRLGVLGIGITCWYAAGIVLVAIGPKRQASAAALSDDADAAKTRLLSRAA